MRRCFPILPGILLAACGSAVTVAPPQAAPSTTAPVVTASRPASASPSLVTATPSADPHASAIPSPGAATTAPLVTGWPTASRSGVTMTGRLVDEPPPFEGCPAPGPAVTLAITVTGLALGEVVTLAGTGSYEFEVLGCGVQPSPCEWGSDTTDPTVHLCRPEYSQTVEGTATTAAQATAGADGRAAATIRFVVPESERACPAGPSRPWYVETGEWILRVTDTTHGLRLAGPPDLGVGP
jgi:hypothetical protein